MVDIKDNNKTKEYFINEIVQDINEIPVVYLRTLCAIIHSFKENILVIEPVSPTKVSEHDGNDDFDWDGLINEIHLNRQENNKIIYNKIDKILID